MVITFFKNYKPSLAKFWKLRGGLIWSVFKQGIGRAKRLSVCTEEDLISEGLTVNQTLVIKREGVNIAVAIPIKKDRKPKAIGVLKIESWEDFPDNPIGGKTFIAFLTEIAKYIEVLL